MASSGSPAPTRTTTLLESGKYTDLTVKVNERKWKVHKAVLCTQSDFFAKLCDSGFKVCRALPYAVVHRLTHV